MWPEIHRAGRRIGDDSARKGSAIIDAVNAIPPDATLVIRWS